ncbi:putative helicase MOV-10 isoform X2 [Toxorhynchites rutilus septentrionalis]|uniref:putative helicase MOV-10 isoform X2 n=1 Tax=Toxorhynchites rutilus septentrionalis TaxID=329112 RepID=UPI00247A92D8|nr:putative helicase MOV-10 isoform X2 [Toxorhynchites rutilus septentrionalis]
MCDSKDSTLYESKQSPLYNASLECIDPFDSSFDEAKFFDQSMVNGKTSSITKCIRKAEQKAFVRNHLKRYICKRDRTLVRSDSCSKHTANHGYHRISRHVLRPSLMIWANMTRFFIRVVNDSEAILILRSVYLLGADKSLESAFNGVLRMKPGYAFDIDCTVENYAQSAPYSIVLMATAVGSSIEIVELYHTKWLRNSRIVGTPLNLDILRCQVVLDSLKELYRNHFMDCAYYAQDDRKCLNKLRAFNKEGLTPTNYIEQLRLLNMIEDYDMQSILATYTIKGVTLVPAEKDYHYLISLCQFIVPPTLLEKDNCVRVSVDRFSNNRGIYVEHINGLVESISENAITITMRERVRFQMPCSVEFFLNRTRYKLEYNALDLLRSVDLTKFLFPKTTSRNPGEQIIASVPKFNWFQTFIGTNREQMRAVRNIVHRTSFPAPYIVVGPPGTGKTATIVEAVLQIWKTQPQAHILLTAPSNITCDELTERLRVFVPERDLFRFYSRSQEHKLDSVDVNILALSNLATGVHEIPSYQHVYGSRIVVSTMNNCGRFAQASICPTVFDYIFIDECNSAKEISVLVPIAGIGTTYSAINASVILSGDPKQLGPIIHCAYLKQTVHRKSMLERLMGLDIYRRDPSTGQYNANVITNLIDSYRSHGSLIHHSNDCFYGSELRPRIMSSSTEWVLHWNYLPNPKFPIIFHSISGLTRFDKRLYSSYNKEEAQTVVLYVKKMLSDGINGRSISEEDIGVVTPYTKQASYLRKSFLNNDWQNIEVGSVEQYQGREKPIMILSTVRSNDTKVGFLSNCKRLNVAITRARALMIIIGNPAALQCDPHWYRLLRYIKDNKGLRGGNFALERMVVDFSKTPAGFAMEEDEFA